MVMAILCSSLIIFSGISLLHNFIAYSVSCLWDVSSIMQIVSLPLTLCTRAKRHCLLSLFHQNLVQLMYEYKLLTILI